MSIVGFPLLLIPLAIYNIIAFLMPGVAFSETLVRVPLPSGELWTISLGDVLLALSALLLLLEVIKAGRPGGKYLTDHILSLVVAGAAAAEFVLWPKFGNSTFCLLTLLATVDFFAGVSLRGKRRAVAVAAAPVEVAPEDEPEIRSQVRPEPAPELPALDERSAVVEHAVGPESQASEPALPPPVPEPVAHEPVSAASPTHFAADDVLDLPAASIAESILLDRSGPKPPPVVQTAKPVEPDLPEPHDVLEAEPADAHEPAAAEPADEPDVKELKDKELREVEATKP